MVEAGQARAEERGGVRAVSRAIQVLEAFRADGTRHSIAGLVRATGLPRTTVLRLVETLQAEGMLAIDRDGLVLPGAGLVAWGALADDVWRLPDAARERMQEVAESIGETVSLYVRTGLHRRVVAQVQPTAHRLRHVVELGDRLPLWGGASAIALLLQEPDELRATLVADVAALGDAPLGADAIHARVAEASAAGVAVSHGVRELGISGVAVPVLDAEGLPLPVPAALAAGGPTARFGPDAVDALRDALVAGAREVRAAGLPLALR